MRIHLFLGVLVVLGWVMGGCGGPRPLVGPNDFKELRTYGWETTVPDPQAQWNPETYQVLTRAAGGFVIFDEGKGKQAYFASNEQRGTHYPVWISRNQFAFGPGENLIRTSDGALVPNAEGLTVVTIGDKLAMTTKTITKVGFRPRVWGERLVAEYQERILLVDGHGTTSEYDRGFFPEPQRHGPGICWQETPVIEPDYWTGQDARRGRLFIRWNEKDRLTELPNAIEARWTSAGGVVATRLRADPPEGQPWWRAGTDVVHVAGPTAAPVVVAADARSAAPHPTAPVVAAVGANGSLIICSLDGSWRRLVAEQGDHPQWSHDGERLIVEEPVEGKPQVRFLKVYIFKVGAAVAPTQP
jgi:hypothetical protein